MTGEGIKELLNELKNLVLKSKKELDVESFESEISVDKLLNVNENELNVEKVANNTYKVEGSKIDKMIGYTNLDTEKGLNFFQKYLVDEGIIQKLKSMGMVEGDTVTVSGIEFTYYD